jgi:3-hydroxyisobutyrate dehydrogenase
MQIPKAQPGTTRVGFIGTGVMGLSMCRNIMNAGYSATVYSRTKSRSQPLLDAGATWADSPKAVAERSDMLFAIVGYPSDVREVFLGAKGAVGGAKAGSVLVDMTTSEPSLAVEIAEAANAKGVAVLDAPVSGGDVGAKNGTLSIMVGGDATALDAARPILECMGKTIVHQGPAGAGQHTKMVNQILIASALNGVCEALLYAKKAGLDAKTVLLSVGGGAAASWQLNNLGPKMIDGNFEPGFYAEHFVKDMAIALSEARQMKLAMPGLSLTAQLFNALLAQGLGRKGTHALYLLLERLSNVTASGTGRDGTVD